MRGLAPCPCPQYVLNGKSLCLFGPTNWLRLKCLALVEHPAFDNTVLALIIVSSILLAVDTPLLNPDSDFSTVCPPPPALFMPLCLP